MSTPNIGLQRTAPCGLAAELGSLAGRITAGLAFTIAIGTACTTARPSRIYHLSEEARFHLLEDPFRISRAVADVPASVRKAFEARHKSPFEMAEPGAAWAATDVDDRDLPGSRLVFLGVSSEYCFVHYENGGIGHSWWVAFFKLSPGVATPEWVGGAFTGKPFSSLGAMRRAIRDGQFNDDPDYFW